jgi:3-deoxy-D-manno-octulosonic-acid transferase
VFLAGSTQAPEEAIALAAFEKLQPRFRDLRLILVPRHPERFDEVDKLLAASGVTYLRRSRIEQGTVPPAWQVLLVDTMGELGAWWGVADVAFVGGSMGDRGGQNMIEPAAFGAAVCFGPNTKNFRDVVTTLLQAEAAVVVRDGAELTAFLERCLRDTAFANALGERAQSLVISQRGATLRTIEILEQFLGRARPSQPHFKNQATQSARL